MSRSVGSSEVRDQVVEGLVHRNIVLLSVWHEILDLDSDCLSYTFS